MPLRRVAEIRRANPLANPRSTWRRASSCGLLALTGCSAGSPLTRGDTDAETIGTVSAGTSGSADETAGTSPTSTMSTSAGSADHEPGSDTSTSTSAGAETDADSDSTGEPGVLPTCDEPGDRWVRPYGPNAAWNVPVAGLPIHPESDEYAASMWSDAPDDPGNFNLTFDGYTYPVYSACDADGEAPVDTTWDTNLDGKSMPWSASWLPADGSDGQVIVLDPDTGREWNLWQVSFDGDTVHATNGNLVQAGIEPGDGNDPASYWTKEDGFKSSRGVGIQYFAMLVVPEEIAQGHIDHALSMPIRNTSGEFFVPPATKLEHPNNGPGIPEGMRFALAVTDEEIEAWVDALPAELPDSTRDSAFVIAVALRDYGWFVTDTSGAAHLQFEDRLTAAAEWVALGLDEQSAGGKEYPRDLLDGLITEERIYAIVPSDEYP
jgi:hypothetical protein